MPKKLLDWAIAVLIVICVALGWMLLWPRIEPLIKEWKASQGKHTVTVEGMRLVGPVSEESLKHIGSFVADTIQKDLLPAELTFQEPPGQTQLQGDEIRRSFIASWNKDGKYFLALLGTKGQNNAPAYLRAWAAPQGTGIEKKEADALVGGMFAPQLLATTGLPVCREETDPQTKQSQTICASMKTREDGSLLGVTVKAPVSIEPPPGQAAPPGIAPSTVIIIAACEIPASEASLYPADHCL